MADTPSRDVERPLVVGANHRSSPLALRDRLFVEDADVPRFLAALRDGGCGHALVLSTCDRVDVLAAHDNLDVAEATARAVLAEHAGIAESELAGHLYVLRDEDAVRHTFAAAAALDSQVIGEPHVLGQLKACHRLARQAGMAEGLLESMLQAAYGAAKRVRSETAVGEGPVSLAAAAVQVARDLHGALHDRRALLIGVGEMGITVAAALMAAGLPDVTVIHPRERRAEAAARALEAHTASFDPLVDRLAAADVVIAALGARRRLLDGDILAAALRLRRRRPIFLIDTATPGDVDPNTERLEEAFVYDLDDLEGVAETGRTARDAEALAAQGIVEAEVVAFLHRRAERDAVPAVTRLRDRFEAARRQVLAEAGGDAERATQLLINRLLHGPSAALRGLAARDDDGDGDPPLPEMAQLIDRLFGGAGTTETPSPPTPKKGTEDDGTG